MTTSVTPHQALLVEELAKRIARRLYDDEINRSPDPEHVGELLSWVGDIEIEPWGEGKPETLRVEIGTISGKLYGRAHSTRWLKPLEQYPVDSDQVYQLLLDKARSLGLS